MQSAQGPGDKSPLIIRHCYRPKSENVIYSIVFKIGLKFHLLINYVSIGSLHQDEEVKIICGRI
jgi:hypothetical protein